MLIAYWIVAGILALLYVISGGQKIVRSRAQLEPMMAWAPTFPAWTVKAIGIVEVLGAIGLIVPPLAGILSALAIAAAIGLALVQLVAIGLHVARGELKVLGFNVFLLALAAVTIWLATVWL